MLRDECIQVQVCRNPDANCAVVVRVHRTIRDRLFKYYTHKNSYRYKEILPKFGKAYNDTIHAKNGMAHSRVTYADVVVIWRRMEDRRQRVRVATATFRVGQHVRMSKEKIRFANAAENNSSTEKFRIVKVKHRRPCVV